MSHTRHDDNQAGNGPRRTDPPSLTVTRRIAAPNSSNARAEFWGRGRAKAAV